MDKIIFKGIVSLTVIYMLLQIGRAWGKNELLTELSRPQATIAVNTLADPYNQYLLTECLRGQIK